MFVRKSEDPSLPQYILVIKDDLSYYVELCPADTADHFAIADCLLEWSNRLDAAKIHVSDRGKHFNNSVLAELNRGKFWRYWKVLLRNSGCHGINSTSVFHWFTVLGITQGQNHWEAKQQLLCSLDCLRITQSTWSLTQLTIRWEKLQRHGKRFWGWQRIYKRLWKRCTKMSKSPPRRSVEGRRSLNSSYQTLK